jgi:hypothetical protein
MTGSQMPSPAPPASGNRADRSSFAGPGKSRIAARKQIDFAAINRAALANLGSVLSRLAPGGKVIAGEYVALNPRRADTRPGSFKVRFVGPRAGMWADFATGDKGGDLISLCAYVEGVGQGEAARRLARMLGLDGGGRRDGR